MAKIKITGFIDELESELKQALTTTLRKHFDQDLYNIKEVYKTFEQALEDKCNSWEHLPNKYIKNG
jgi:cob(I)alamin adenosyltransferase